MNRLTFPVRLKTLAFAASVMATTLTLWIDLSLAQGAASKPDTTKQDQQTPVNAQLSIFQAGVTAKSPTPERDVEIGLEAESPINNLLLRVVINGQERGTVSRTSYESKTVQGNTKHIYRFNLGRFRDKDVVEIQAKVDNNTIAETRFEVLSLRYWSLRAGEVFLLNGGGLRRQQ